MRLMMHPILPPTNQPKKIPSFAIPDYCHQQIWDSIGLKPDSNLNTDSIFMRIIGGRESGTRLATPKGQGVRPTQDRVREAIFNRLAQDLIGATVLDLFSGTGAMGLESVSRGASEVLCVEKSALHGRTIKQNIRACGYLPNKLTLRIGCTFATIRSFAESSRKFDIIFADPPFGEKTTIQRSQSMAQRLFDDQNLTRIADEHSIVIIGHASRDKIEIPSCWQVLKAQRYGDATINFLRKADVVERPDHKPEA